MARARYDVVYHQGEWKISHQGTHYGPYKTKADAVREAVDTAHKAGGSGHDAQVYVHKADGTFQLEWTYGHDPYPPRG